MTTKSAPLTTLTSLIEKATAEKNPSGIQKLLMATGQHLDGVAEAFRVLVVEADVDANRIEQLEEELGRQVDEIHSLKKQLAIAESAMQRMSSVHVENIAAAAAASTELEVTKPRSTQDTECGVLLMTAHMTARLLGYTPGEHGHLHEWLAKVHEKREAAKKKER